MTIGPLNIGPNLGHYCSEHPAAQRELEDHLRVLINAHTVV